MIYDANGNKVHPTTPLDRGITLMMILVVLSWILFVALACSAPRPSAIQANEPIIVEQGSLTIRHYQTGREVHCYIAEHGSLGIAMSCVVVGSISSAPVGDSQ